MRHRKDTLKLGLKSEHRRAMLGNMVCDLIQRRRITTTLTRAKAVRRLAEKMVTLGKRNNLSARRLAIRRLRQTDPVGILFREIAPVFGDRNGGYTRIVKLGRRSSDSSEMAILEWVNYTPPAPKAKKEKKGEAKDKKAPPAPAAPSPAAEKKEPAKESPATEIKSAPHPKPKKAQAAKTEVIPEAAPEKPAERKGLFRRKKKEEPPKS